MGSSIHKLMKYNKSTNLTEEIFAPNSQTSPIFRTQKYIYFIGENDKLIYSYNPMTNSFKSTNCFMSLPIGSGTNTLYRGPFLIKNKLYVWTTNNGLTNPSIYQIYLE